MKRFFSFLTLFLTLIFLLFPQRASLASQTPAKEKKDQKVLKETTIKCFHIFRKLFFSNYYDSLKCQDNIYKLLKKLKTSGIDTGSIKVIFIFDKYHYKLLPVKSREKADQGIRRPTIATYKTRLVPFRNAPPNHFRYHVFAEIGGFILDFDYTNSPSMVTADNYFKEMFFPPKIRLREKRLLCKRLTIRLIPAPEYLKEYPRHPSYYLYDLDKRYPALSLSQYLKHLEKNNKKEKARPVKTHLQEKAISVKEGELKQTGIDTK